MARMRTLKPEFWTDEELACQLTRDERLLYLGLWNLADEHSRLRGNPSYIKGQLLAYDDDITVADIERMLARLAELGKVRPYSAGVGRYLYLPNLAKHQRLDADKVPSKLPCPDLNGSGPDRPEPDPVPPGSDPDQNVSNPDKPGLDPIPPGSDPDKSGRDPNISGRGPEKPVLLYVAGSREHVAGGRYARTGARDAPPKTVLADLLLTEHLAARPSKPPRDVIKQLGEAIDSLLDDSEIQPDEIREGLRLLRAKPRLGPGILKNLVDEYRQGVADPGLAQRASPQRPRDYSRGGAGDPLTGEDYSKEAIL